MIREEAKEIFLNRGFIDGVYDGNKWREACIVISKWLEQEPILDRVRAKIKVKLAEPLYQHEEEDWKDGLIMALEIIDKYKAEREG